MANTVTAGDQRQPDVAKLSAGGFVTVWIDAGSDATPGRGVVGQVFDAAGAKVGAEFVVDSQIYEAKPEVIGLATGGFAVSWYDQSGGSTLQIFDGGGAKVGAAIDVPVNYPRELVSLDNGNFIALSDTGSGRVYDSAGQTIGDGFSLAGSDGANPTAAALAGGGFVVVGLIWGGDVGFKLFDGSGDEVSALLEYETQQLGAQGIPSAAGLAGGGFVIVHESNHQIYATIFDSAGAQISDEITITSDWSVQALEPVVTATPDGGFIVSWATDSTWGLLQTQVLAQVFDASGGEVGGEFLVSRATDHPNRNHDRPAITMLDSGSFVVAWDGAGPGDARTAGLPYDQSDNGIRVQIYDPLPPAAPDIAPSSTIVSEVAIENLAVLALDVVSPAVNGEYSWSLIADSTGGAFGIAGRNLIVVDRSRLDFESAQTVSVTVRVTDNGGNVSEEVISLQITDAGIERSYEALPETVVAEATSWSQADPSIGSLAGGGYVVTWSNGDSAVDGSGSGIQAQIFSADGTATGTVFRVNAEGNSSQEDPAVAGLVSGGFVVAWATMSTGKDDWYAVKAQRFDAAGAKIGGEFLVNTTVAETQWRPEVAALTGGGFVVSWQDHSMAAGDASGSAIRLQVYDAAGARVGSQVLVNTSTTGNQDDHAIAGIDGGGFVVTWTDANPASDGSLASVKGQLFGASGVKLGGEFLVNSQVLGSQSNSAVGAAGTGFVIAWASYLGVRAQVYASDGTRIGEEMAVAGAGRGEPAVVELPGGGFMISWTRAAGGSAIDVSGTSIEAQRYDAAGNRVGETFTLNDAAPYNQSGSDLTGLASGGIATVWQDFTSGDYRGDVRSRVLLPTETTVMGTNAADSLTGTAGADFIFGEAGNDQLAGLDGNDHLDGGAGADAMAGGRGNDTYIVDDAADTVTEAVGEGTDLVESAVTFSLAGSFVEMLKLTGVQNLDGTGNGLNNKLSGNAGANVLDGAAGADEMAGGAGNDRYVVDHAGDVVVELAGQGIDTIDAAIAISLAGLEVENLRLTGNLAINGTGNAFANSLTGNTAANKLDGGAGADTMSGGLGNDRYIVDDASDKVIEKTGEGIDLVESSVSFSLAGQFVEKLTLTGTAAINGTGNGLDNLITGNSQANLINGGAGADEMAGRKGDDIYVVDNALDKVIEIDGEGSDTVNASVNYSLAGQFAEVLNLTGNAVSGTGNGLANRIVGNGLANSLNGGAGNDRLDGGIGADTMVGGLGNDVFVVDNASDKVTEKVGEGTDTVEASISYSLAGQYVELLKLTGTANLDATGNNQANALTGNAGANRLDGQGGADEMAGGAGNDLYVVDNVGDKVVELAGEGTDSVQASVTFSLAGQYAENLSLTGSGAINATGNGLDNVLAGNGAANTLSGGAGNDVLNGGAGSDRLAGGAGADIFVFDTGLGATNVDLLLDFVAADDTVRLDRSVFGALAEGTLNASAFVAGTAAKDADDRIVFEKASGDLWYDADGSGAGAAVLFANFGAGEVLSAADFVVVA